MASAPSSRRHFRRRCVSRQAERLLRVACLSLGLLYWPAFGSDPVRVQTQEEVEQSYWNRIKDSTDPADFADYEKQFPGGAHGAEAALLARKLHRAQSGDAGANAAPATSAAPGEVAPVRYAVAHKHTFSWCYGYLYVSNRSVRFEVVQPTSDQAHGFEAKRAEVSAVQWSVIGNPQPAVELHAKGQTYILTWLANEGEVQSGGAHRMSPPQANPPYQLLAALSGAGTESNAEVPVRLQAPPKPSTAAPQPGAAATASTTPAGSDSSAPGTIPSALIRSDIAAGDRLDGIFLGKKLTVVMGLRYGSTHMDDLFFRFYPNGGFVQFAAGSFAPNPVAPPNTADRFFSGTYKVGERARISYRFRDQTEEDHGMTIVNDASKTSLGAVYELCTCDGLTLNATYVFDGPSISFSSDGRFADRGVLRSAVADTEANNARPGAGSYSIAANRATFSFNDGRQVTTFFATTKSAGASPAWIKLGSLTANSP